jgi:uroporphyrinogen-III synthase
MRLWVTRSQPGADRQAGELRAEGYDVLVAPVLQIVPTDERPPRELPDVVIFVSEQAVRHCGALDFCRRADVFAVGARTRQALAERGVDAVSPEQATSEGLLALPELRRLDNRIVLIVSGEGGRSLLQDELNERGARVLMFRCYRRQAATPLEIDASCVDAIVAASGEGLARALEVWRAAGGAPSVPVLVPSHRVAEEARRAGCPRVVECAGADTRAILSALERLGADER